MTLTYLTATGQRRVLTFATREAYEVAVRIATDGGLTVVVD